MGFEHNTVAKTTRRRTLQKVVETVLCTELALLLDRETQPRVGKYEET